ncbi:hypothetical protein BQ8482_250108 [Mesorhizobium delmotii]|uniref:Uncharacterized protein n=1 Tax=Mesorhizobium delmotii TaxID=1631247 RepID=A0A2P9AM54_9HYPH|nr:hypothetical protein BQ8482_250108 [Mesorhizobium delmotii]
MPVETSSRQRENLVPAPVASCWSCEAADLQRLAALHLSESGLPELEHSEVLPASEIRGLHKGSGTFRPIERPGGSRRTTSARPQVSSDAWLAVGTAGQSHRRS